MLTGCYGAVLLVVFAGKVAVVVISLADGGTVTDGANIRTETGNKLTTELLESVCGMENGVRVDVDVASPDVFPAVFAGAAAVAVSLSAITGVVFSAVFTEGVMTDAIPLVDVQMVTDRVIVLPDAGSALPAVFAEVGAVCAASSAEVEKITFGLADMDSGESVSRADIAGEFSDVGDEQSAVGRSTWTAVVPIIMKLNIHIEYGYSVTDKYFQNFRSTVKVVGHRNVFP